ncbi:hypothetical protein KSK55_04515 [Methanospirillum purgamenti]|uniref:Uncharacterized protein n=1 Tax=Methanospirillum hungatei TaxID=2203 RepID=A0A8F5ZGF9_METHU|nr:hypothetical protein [Methanospirillum hungatei]QXO95664.1 hypothetical protein KSK55_04515 [Methanospirillum hungatei]
MYGGLGNDPGLAQEEGCFVFSGLTKRNFFYWYASAMSRTLKKTQVMQVGPDQISETICTDPFFDLDSFLESNE